METLWSALKKLTVCKSQWRWTLLNWFQQKVNKIYILPQNSLVALNSFPENKIRSSRSESRHIICTTSCKFLQRTLYAEQGCLLCCVNVSWNLPSLVNRFRSRGSLSLTAGLIGSIRNANPSANDDRGLYPNANLRMCGMCGQPRWVQKRKHGQHFRCQAHQWIPFIIGNGIAQNLMESSNKCANHWRLFGLIFTFLFHGVKMKLPVIWRKKISSNAFSCKLPSALITRGILRSSEQRPVQMNNCWGWKICWWKRWMQWISEMRLRLWTRKYTLVPLFLLFVCHKQHLVTAAKLSVSQWYLYLCRILAPSSLSPWHSIFGGGGGVQELASWTTSQFRNTHI